MYILGGVNLSQFSFTAIRQDDSDVGLSGFLNMPARLGDTSFSWARDSGIEPYVSAADIELGGFAGRDLSLTGVITGNNHDQCYEQLLSLHALIDSFTDLVPLTWDFGSYQVYVDNVVSGEYLPDGGSTKGIRVTIPMREPFVSLAGTVPAADSEAFGIDDHSFTLLGGASLSLAGDRYNRPAPKSADTTVWGREAYQINKVGAKELVLRIGLKQATPQLLIAKVQALMALFSSPGLRTLSYQGYKYVSFFVKDGFTASNIHMHADTPFCVIEVKLIECGLAGTLTDLVTVLGDLITYNGDKIQVRI
jgi:hypothetical protein